MKRERRIENLVRELDMEIDPRVDERMLDSTLGRLKESTQNPPADCRPMTWRTIMKNPLTKLSVAAAVMIAVLLGIHFITSTSDTAWASVLERVADFDTYVFRTREVKTTGPRPDGFEFATEGGSKHYYSQTYGTLFENYKNDGELFTRIYTLLQQKEFVAICYPLESFKRRPLTEEQIHEFHENPLKDPRQIIASILEGDYEALGDDVIDGRPVRGVELSDPAALSDDPVPPVDDFAMRVWIDAETELPVWVEISAVPEGSPTRHTTIIDQFQWGVPVSYTHLTLPTN